MIKSVRLYYRRVASHIDEVKKCSAFVNKRHMSMGRLYHTYESFGVCMHTFHIHCGLLTFVVKKSYAALRLR